MYLTVCVQCPVNSRTITVPEHAKRMNHIKHVPSPYCLYSPLCACTTLLRSLVVDFRLGPFHKELATWMVSSAEDPEIPNPNIVRVCWLN
jgi:hypothetical protein